MLLTAARSALGHPSNAHVIDQGLHPPTDVVADRPDLLDRLALRVVQAPILHPAEPDRAGDLPHDPDDLAEKAKVFRALGEEVRLKLLHLVRDHEACVCDLVALMAMPQGTLSHHLGVLQQAGLVTARKQGRWNYYMATPLALGTVDRLQVAAVG